MRVNRVLLAIWACVFLAGCAEPRPPLRVSDPDVTIKALAIRKAVREKDFSAIGPMIQDLDSDDPAVRFMAIEGLRRLTDEDFGYEYYFNRDQRQLSLLKWNAWYAQQRTDRTERGGGR